MAQRTPSFHTFVLAGFIGLSLASCTPVTANRGYIVDPDLLSAVKTGESTREQVVDKIGSPSHVAPFDEKIWYYMGRRTEQESFFYPDSVDRKVVRIAFDDSGIVKSIDQLDNEQPVDIDPVDRTTPTYGRDNTLIQDLFGGIGRPGLPGNAGKRRAPGGGDR